MQLFSINGTLHLEVVEAKELRDCETFGKMDVYCTLDYIVENEAKKLKTKTHSRGGTAPVWNDKFDIILKNTNTTDLLTLTVFDAETFGSDDLVGSCAIEFSKLKNTLFGGLDTWFDIKHDGKDAGKVHLKATFVQEPK